MFRVSAKESGGGGRVRQRGMKREETCSFIVDVYRRSSTSLNPTKEDITISNLLSGENDKEKRKLTAEKKLIKRGKTPMWTRTIAASLTTDSRLSNTRTRRNKFCVL